MMITGVVFLITTVIDVICALMASVAPIIAARICPKSAAIPY